MFISKYNHFLYFNKLLDEDAQNQQEKYEKIKFNQFKLSNFETRRKTHKCPESVSIESNYMLTKISKQLNSSCALPSQTSNSPGTLALLSLLFHLV